MASNSKASHAEKKKELLAKKGSKAGGDTSPGLTREAAAPIAPEPKLAAVPDLPKIIEDSKATLHAEQQAELPRKRGRPPGSTKKVEDIAPPPSPDPVAQVAEVSVAPMISDTLQMVYNQRADETGFEGYRIAPQKADMLAMQLDAVASAYLPQLSEKSSIVVVCALSWGMHVLGTEMGYRRWKLSKEAKQAPKPEAVEKKIQAEITQPPILAANYFAPKPSP